MIIANYAIASKSVDNSLLPTIGILLEKYSAILNASILNESITGPRFQDIEPVVITTKKGEVVLTKVFIDVVDPQLLITKIKSDLSKNIVAKFSRWLLGNGIIIKSLYKMGYNLASRILGNKTTVTPQNLLGKLTVGKITYAILSKEDMHKAGISNNPNQLISIMRMGWRKLVITDDANSVLYLYFDIFRGRCVVIPYGSLQKMGQNLRMGYNELGSFNLKLKPTMPIDRALAQ